ncbi:MAG: tetratricopeptide repeat protein [Acidobacteriaceae bacterium]|nr:tetratricopeptide repeat protein [Acidobacteriaceae bacterium]
MSYLYVSPRRLSFPQTCLPAILLWTLAFALPSAAQQRTALPALVKQPSSSKASAYYHYSLGHMYEELAAAGGNRGDYINKAIENYRLTLKEDPSASFLVEDIAELYRLSGRIREAVDEAQDALKANPDDLNARRVLARIYTQQIGDAQANHIDEGMARRAVEQYKIISDKDPKDTDSLIMLGRLNRVLNNSVDAEAAFKKVLAADPDNEDATTGLASVYADHGDAKGASALLEKLTKKNPSAKAYATLANSYESMKEYSLAADAYKKALEIDSTRAELRGALAQDQALAGKYDDALKTYGDMAEADPKNPQPYLGMSQIYREQKDYGKAREALNKAKELDPENLEIQYNEVRLLQEEGKTAEAITTLKSVLDSTARRTYDASQRGFRAQMLEQLGSLYRSNEQYEQAAEAFRQIGTLDPDLMPRAEAQVIDTYRTARDYSKAQAESDAALKKYPNDRTIHEVRAQLLADQGKTDAALGELNKLLDGKNDREIYVAMADINQKAKRYSEATKNLDQADKLSQAKEDKSTVLFMRGAMYEREKKYDEAEKVFRQVLEADPSNASALNYLGYMLADRNIRLPEAQDLIQRALKIEPNNYAFLDSLGWVYFKMNKLSDAEQQLTRSIELSSKDPTIHDHLGDVYFKEGKIKEAIAEWQSSLKQWNNGPASDAEPEDMAKVQKKLDSARVRLAKGQGLHQNGNQ